MQGILRDYLVTVTTPEHLAELENAHRVLEEIGLEDHHREFEELLTTAETVGPSDTVDYVNALTKMFLVQLVNHHSVMVTDEISIKEATAILSALMLLPDYEVKTDVLTVLGQDVSNEEKFGQLVELTTAMSTEETMLVVTEVGDALLRQLGELLKTGGISLEDADESVVRNKCIAQLQNFLSKIEGYDNYPVIVNLKNGLDVGMDFFVYADSLKGKLDPSKLEVAVDNLLIAAYCSRDGLLEPKVKIMKVAETLLGDSTVITRFEAILNDRLIKAGQHETQ